MTLNGYLNSLDEMSCSDGTDPEGILDYIERWEARQPKPVEDPKLKEVDTPARITAATKAEYQDNIKEELPDAYASAKVHRENIALLNQDLKLMVDQYQKPPVPGIYCNCMQNQRYLYQVWCRKLLDKERIPSYEDFGVWTFGWIWLMFGLKEPDELAMVFGFGDLLPKGRRDPERAACLMYRGFLYSCDQKFVIENRDAVLAELNKKRLQREAVRTERLIQQCVYQATNATQIRVDSIVEDTRRKMRHEQQQREAEAARQRQTPEATRSAPTDIPRQDTATRHTTALSALTGVICKLVVTAIEIANELFDGTH